MWVLEFEPEIGYHHLHSIKITGNTLNELIQNAQLEEQLGTYKTQLDTGKYVGVIYWQES
jgi:hypothetical protein